MRARSDKDIDCDIRENIINYEDEGGGEVDQAGYDLSVLRMMSNGTPAIMHPSNQIDGKGMMHGKSSAGHNGIPGHPGGLEAAPDIQTFLQTNKVPISFAFHLAACKNYCSTHTLITR